MNRTLPSAIDAEGQVIGALMIDPTRIGDIAKLLRPADFVDPYHRLMFATITAMHGRREPIDVVAVSRHLKTSDMFAGPDISAAGYLAGTGVAVSTVAHVQHHAELVQEAGRKRRLHDLASTAAEHTLNGQGSSEVLADLLAGVEDLRSEIEPSERFAAISAAELDGGNFSLAWLIDWLLVEGQPCILAGPKKTLKTSLLLALMLALATGNEFLGKFAIRKARRVLFCSGESGMATLQETARRIARAMEWELRDVPNFAITADLPRLDSLDDLAEFESFLERQEAEVVGIDPAYLCMGADNSGNLFAQGAVLLGISQLCQRLGITLILCHHTKRNTGRDAFDVPELEDIAWAGFQEFARQWLLVGRRERYEPGSGVHRLWLSVGGSAGHGGLYAVNIEEGTAQTPGGRYWSVTLNSATEAHGEAEQRKADIKQQQQAEQLEADVAAILKALAALPNREGTKTGIRDATGIRSTRFDPALAEAISAGHVTQTTIKKGNNRPYDGYKLA